MALVSDEIISDITLVIAWASVAVVVVLSSWWLTVNFRAAGATLRYITASMSSCMEPEASEVSERVDANRIELAVMFARCFGPALTLWLAWELSLVDKQEDDVVSNALSFSIWAFTNVFATSLAVFPSLATTRSVHAFYAFFMLTTVVMVSPVGSSPGELAERLLTWEVFMIITSIGCLHRWQNAFWIMMAHTSAALNFALSEESSCLAYTLHVAELLMLGVCLALMVALFDTMVRGGVRKDIGLRAYKRELSARKAILSSICDAVIEIDESYKLREDSGDLKQMLMLNPSHRVMGKSLLVHMRSQKDWEKFRLQLNRINKECDEGDSDCVVFHVSFRDSAGVALNIEIVCVGLRSSSDSRSYLLGLREFTDIAPLLELPQLNDDTGRRSRGRRRQWKKKKKTAIESEPPQDQAEEDSDNVSGVSVSSKESSAAGDRADSWEIAVWVNPDSEGFAVTRCSLQFQRCGWFPDGHDMNQEKLLNWVAPHQREDFLKWAALVADPSAAKPSTVGGVYFRFGNLPSRRMWIKCTVVLATVRGDSIGEQQARPVQAIKVFFVHVAWVQGKHLPQAVANGEDFDDRCSFRGGGVAKCGALSS